METFERGGASSDSTRRRLTLYRDVGRWIPLNVVERHLYRYRRSTHQPIKYDSIYPQLFQLTIYSITVYTSKTFASRHTEMQSSIQIPGG